MTSETDLFEQWFRLADGNNDGKVEGPEAVQFFQRSGLPKEALREIWSQTAGDSPYMSKPQFFAALRLVALGQNNGGTFSIQQARAVMVGTAPPLPTPKLQGLTAETWQPGSPIPHQFSSAAGPAAVPATGAQWPPMSQIDLTRLEQMFLQLDQDRDGILKGSDCSQAFMQMGVDRSVLKTIWGVVAGDVGYLGKDQFIKCVYLIEMAQKGISPPITLPPEPFPPIAQPMISAMVQRAASLNQQTFPTLPPQATFQPPGAAPYQARGLELSDTSMSMLGPVERGRLDAERESALAADKQLFEEENKLATARQKREFYEKSLQDIVLFRRRVGNKLVEVQEQERKVLQEAEETEKMYQQGRIEAEEAAQESGAMFDRIKEAQEKRSEVEAQLHTLQKEVAEMEGANPQEVEKIEAEIQSLAEEVAAVEAKKQSLGAQLESYKSQQAALNKQKDDLQLVCAAAEAEVHSAVADIDKIKSQVDEAKSSEDIDQIQKLLRETARVYSNLHSHALKAGIDIPKETRLMLYGQDLMYADDMIGSNVDMEDWNEEGFIIVDAFPDVKDELDKALFDAVMSSNKGTPQSKAAQTPGFEANFGAVGTFDMGVPLPTSTGPNFMSSSDTPNALPDIFGPTPDPPGQQDSTVGFDSMFGPDTFAPSVEPSKAPVQTTNQTDPFSSFPLGGKEGQEPTGLGGFAVSFDAAPASNTSFGDFGNAEWTPVTTSTTAAAVPLQSGVIPVSSDPFAIKGTAEAEQKNPQADNPFGDSAFG